MFDGIQYRILKVVARHPAQRCDGSAYDRNSKLLTLLGDDLRQKIPGRRVVDYGCGDGRETVELAKLGAREVIGVDIRDSVLARARERAHMAGVGERCRFEHQTSAQADVVICIDCFEHFADPAGELLRMHALLVPGGTVEISFGPTWYHPLGGHLFSVFPWAHVIFSEDALIRWRSAFISDGARRFGEVSGGLNQMTIWRFEKLVTASPFRVEQLRCVPIRRLTLLHCGLTRELTTSVVRCTLRKKGSKQRLGQSARTSGAASASRGHAPFHRR